MSLNRQALSKSMQQYALITANYWAFTLTDGALRMLILLHFHTLGYTPLQIAFVFLFYELFGVITNLLGGWLGAQIGLNKTMNIGLFLQIAALSLLLVPQEYLTISLVMGAQALSGIAKDLNKMSAKSAIKLLVPDNAQGQLFKWVAILTGSKNTLKGVGFFVGGALLAAFGFKTAIASMAVALSAVWILSLLCLQKDLGQAQNKSRFKAIFSKSRAINVLSGARLFLFASRDVWFVVALPVFLTQQFAWSHTQIGSFIALWVIGYGLVQALTPKLLKIHSNSTAINKQAFHWAALLSLIPLAISAGLHYKSPIELTLITGLAVFGIVFAINSSLHSYLIIRNASQDGVSLDVGFYYMANALGRLTGTILSGWMFQLYGIISCLLVSALFIGISALFALALPQKNTAQMQV